MEISARPASSKTPIVWLKHSGLLKRQCGVFFSFSIPYGFFFKHLCLFFKLLLLVLQIKRLSPEILFCEAQQKHRKERLSFLQSKRKYGAGVEGGAAHGGNEKSPENN